MAARASWRERRSSLARSFQIANMDIGVEINPTNGQQGTGEKIEMTNAVHARPNRDRGRSGWGAWGTVLGGVGAEGGSLGMGGHRKLA